MSRSSRSRGRLAAMVLATAVAGGVGGFFGLGVGSAEAASPAATRSINLSVPNLVCVAVAEVQVGVCVT